MPGAVLHTLSKQLRLDPVNGTSPYSTGEQRWLHATEIRESYGYVEITEQGAAFRLTRWLYALSWTGTDRPSVLFERAITWLVMHKVLLPGCSTLERYIARLRSRVEERLWRSLANGVGREQQTRLENLLVVPTGTRSSQLVRLRAGPLTVSGPSLVKAIGAALNRLRTEGYPVKDEDSYRLSPLQHENINMLGRYSFSMPDAVAKGELRPLRNPEDTNS
jgi:Domain of unknown function (DUF4158)/Tn3 transposase DDE domain